MTIKTTRGASPATYIFAPDNTALNIPAAPEAWTLCFIATFDGLTTGDNSQYLISTGPYQGAGSFNLVYQTAGATSSLRNKLVLYTNTSSSAVVTTTNDIVPGKTYLWALHQDGTVLRVRRIEIVAAASADLLPVLVDGSNTRSLALDPTAGLYLGNRADLVADRSSDQSIGRPFYLLGTLTDAELQQLAFGKEITELGKSPTWYVRLDNADDLTNRGSSNMTFTKNGAVTTSATQPTFGYVPGSEPPAQPADAVGVAPLTAERIFQRSGTTAAVAMSGTYVGTAPTSVEYQLYAEDGTTVLKAWATSGATIGGSGTWSAAPAIPQGGMYRRQVRTKNGTAVLATGAVEPELFGVGDLHACGGSSSAEKRFDSTSGTGFTPAANVRKYNSAGWAKFGIVGCAIVEANDLAARAGVPIGMLDYGIGGDTLTEWITSTYSGWVAFKNGITAVGGKLASAMFFIGSNDAAAELVVSRTQHAANLRTLIANTRAHAGQPNLPILLSGFNRRTDDTFPEQADFVRMAENDVGKDANVYHVQTLDFVLSSDGTHLSSSNANGFRASAARNAYVLGRRLYGDKVYAQGAVMTSYSISGNEVIATISHRGGSDFTPATGITGFAGISASGAALTPTAVVRVDSTHIKITFAEAPTRITYLAGNAPPVGTQVFDNGEQPLPMSVETEMRASQGGTTPDPDPAPVATRTVSITLAIGKDAAGNDILAANLSGVMVGFRTGTGPHNSGAALYQSGTETTNASGVLSFSFQSNAMSAGQSGLLEVMTPDGGHYLGLATVA